MAFSFAAADVSSENSFSEDDSLISNEIGSDEMKTAPHSGHIGSEMKTTPVTGDSTIIIK